MATSGQKSCHTNCLMSMLVYILESIDECGAHLRDECHTLQEQNLAKQLIGTRLFKYWS